MLLAAPARRASRLLGTEDGRGGGCATTNPFSTGQSLLHPVKTSSMFLPPVMTIFPEKKQSSTTGEASGL